MNCIKCKKEIPEGSVFCMFCGKKQEADRRVAPKRPNQTGTAYKRGKTWTAMVVVGYTTNKDGAHLAVKRTKGGFRTKTEALNACAALRESPKEVRCRKTFQQLYDEWLPWYEPKVGKSTMNCYKAAYNHYKDIYWKRFLDISPKDMQDCINACEHGKRTKENMKALASLLYQYAMFLELTPVNKALTLDTGDDERHKYPAITKSELETIMASSEPYASYVAVLCYMGCRPNELFKLKKKDFNEVRRCVVTGSKTPAGIDRIITISPKVMHIFRQQMETPGEWLFPCLPKEHSPNAWKKMTVNHFGGEFKDLMTKLGIGNRVPYSCRHTFSNLLKSVKGSDTDKASLMGHADASMTKYYQEADYDSLLAITDAL